VAEAAGVAGEVGVNMNDVVENRAAAVYERIQVGCMYFDYL
jgi:hypothetical protein